MDNTPKQFLTLRSVINIVSVVLILWLLFILREVVIILILSFIFSAALDPLVDYLEKRKTPRVLAIGGIYLVVILLLVLVIRLIIPPLIDQASMIVSQRDFYIDKILAFLSGLDVSLKEYLKSNASHLITSIAQAGEAGILSGASGIFNGVVDFILVLVISFYLLLEKDGTEKWITSYVPKAYQTKSLSIAKKITTKMSHWFRGQLFLGVIIFAIVYLGLSLLRVEFALTLAILAGFLELLPVIGPLIAGALAALVALTTSPVLSLIVISFYFLVQQLENHILVPLIMKKTLGLNPVAIIISLLVGGKLLGVIGIIIAVPVAAIISVLFNELYKNNLGGEVNGN